MKKDFLILFLILFCGNSFSQVTFQKTYGGTGGESANDISKTFDGGYIIAGYSASFGSMQDAFLVKIDSNGDTLWTKAYGGAANEYFRAVRQTSDGGYIATGSTNSGFPDNNLYLVKTDSTGNLLWSKAYKGASEEIGNAVEQTSDGGYIITGNYGLASLYLIKTDSVGDTLWTKTLNGAIGWSVIQNKDGDYFVGGEILAAGSETVDFYLVKTNRFGDTLWTKIYGDTANETGKEMKPTRDGGFIIAGSTTSYGAGGSDAYIVKTDSAGNLLWSRAYGGAGSDVANSIEQTNDGGYILAGNTTSFGSGANDIYLIKTDSTGALEWSNVYGGTGGELGYRVLQADDGGFVVVAQTLSFGAGAGDMYVIKTDSLGNSNCNQSAAATVVTIPPTTQSVYSKVLGSGAIPATPAAAIHSGCTINSLCTTVGISDEFKNSGTIFTIYPDPSHDNFSVYFPQEWSGNLQIFDFTGRVVYQQKIDNMELALVNAQLSAGVYFVKVSCGEREEVKKLIVE